MPGPTPRTAVLLLALASACATPGPAPGAPAPAAAEGGREVLLRFARAVEGGRWEEAWPLLSARWRSATSPGRLAADYRGAGPVAREAGERVVSLLTAGAVLHAGPGRLVLPVGAGREARLVEEPGGWRVDALE
ncbi:MAG: hypothetical protein NDI82_11580 [Anaeromyxobacteraceae bacterium]|nr:hypothetical protein [Anaeromyxobacteraceae bacterium]